MESEENENLVESSQDQSRFQRVREKLRQPTSSILDHLENFLNVLDHSTNREVLEEGFDLVEELRVMDGPIVEFGGPTDKKGSAHSHPFLGDIKESGQELLVSNVRMTYKGIVKNKKGEARFIEFSHGKVDFLADARMMPLADNSMGAIFASYLPILIRKDLLHESQRALRENGLLIIQGVTDEDIQLAENLGLQPVDVVTYKDRFGKRETAHHFVFRKIVSTVVEQE